MGGRVVLSNGNAAAVVAAQGTQTGAEAAAKVAGKGAGRGMGSPS